MYNPYKRLTAQLLLFSLLLESCYNPHIGVSKKIPPTPKRATYQQHQYEENTYSKKLEPSPSLTYTTADGQAITFTYHNQAWQAAVYTPKGHRQLPVTFEPGYTMEDLADKDPQEQQQWIHLCPNKYNTDPINHVYIGKAETYEQYLSKIATNQHPQPAETNTQQQPELRVLPSPVQPIPAKPNSQYQAASTPLPIPSSTHFKHKNVQNTYNNAHKLPNKRTLTLKKQHALTHTQRNAQIKRQEQTAKPTDEPTQTAQPRQATPSTPPPIPTPPPSPEARTSQDITSPTLLAQDGQRVYFMHKNGQWRASIREQIGIFSRTEVLPVYCERHGDIAAALRALQGKPERYVQQRIHVMTTKQLPYVPKFVFIGEQSLQGGGEGEASGSGEPQGEPPTRGHADATDNRPRPSLTAIGRSASMALRNRMAKADITSTAGLVEALNAAQTLEERQNLQEWVRAYIEWFNREPVGNLTQRQGAAIQEYSLLAGIRADNQDLLREYFNSLCNKVKQGQYGEESLIEALEYTLQTLDIGVLEGRLAQLIELADELLAKLKTDKTIFNQHTYPTHRSRLYALHQVLVLIREIDPDQWDPTEKDTPYSRFQAQLQAMAKKAKYYPICYHIQLLGQSLQRLEAAGNQACLQDRVRRVAQGLKGAFYLYKGVRALATLDFDLKAFKSSYESLEAAFDKQYTEGERWYDCHQVMNHACLLSLEDAEQYKKYEQCLRRLKEQEGVIGKQSDCKALRYGIVQQLSLLALEGPTAAIRKGSMEELSFMAESCKVSDGKSWLEDVEVLEEVLEGLSRIAVQSQGGEKEEAEVALEILIDASAAPARRRFLPWVQERRESATQKAIREWLGGQVLEDKLRGIPAPASGPALGGLFSKINKSLRSTQAPRAPYQDSEYEQQVLSALSSLQTSAPVESQPPSVVPMPATAVREGLRARYQQSDFAQVRSLFDGEAPKHVERLQCELQLIEQVKVKADPEKGKAEGEGSAADARQDQLATHHERLAWVKTPIALEDIFKRRSTKPDEPEQEIHKVLLVGEAGTGKTTLSRKLAYSWAKDTWGKEFEAVYVLPVRALQESKYDNVHFRREETLTTAIVNNCFATQNKEEEYKRLRHQISEELDKPTTLVVLDGLDERYGASEQLLNQAKGGKHKLLMLSRPYGIEAERPLADIEIEHAGFNDKQMQAFITDELSPELGEELLAFIREQPAIGAIAHVPVNLQILCALWKDDGAGVRAETKNGSLPGLYGRLTGYTCTRYEERQRKVNAPIPYKDREELFDTLGQIAVRGLERGEVLLSQGLVEGVLAEGDGRVRDMLKDAGFLLLQDLGKQYQFPHLTFQEYFAGRWLARQFLSEESHEQARVKRFFSKHRYQGQYAVTFSFMAGEVVKRQKFDGMKQLLKLIEAFPREVVGVQHVLLQVRLLHEWLCVSGNDLQEELAELEEECHILQSLKEWLWEGLLEEAKLRGYRWDGDNLLSLLITRLRTVAAHALEPLINACMDKNRKVRGVALESLGHVVAVVPGEAPYVREALVNACKDEDFLVREAAFKSLGQVIVAVPGEAPSVREALFNVHKDKNAGVRNAGLKSLGQVVVAVPGEAPYVREVLINDCQDKNVYVRKSATGVLGHVVAVVPGEAPYVREALVNACKDEDVFVRKTALSSFGQMVAFVPREAPYVREALVNVCKDKNIGVRGAALESLGQVVASVPGEAPYVREVLINACKDEDVFVRKTALSSFGQMVVFVPGEAPCVREALMNGCKDEDFFVHEAALKSLGQVIVAVPEEAPSVREALVNACKDKNTGVRRAALESLGKVVAAVPGEAPFVREFMINVPKDKNTGVRRAALESLGKVVAAVPGEAPFVREVLIHACKDEDVSVRVAALRSLSQVVAAVPGEAPSVREALIDACKDEDASVRVAALKSLGLVIAAVPAETPSVREALMNGCKDEDFFVREAALESLGKMVAAVPGEAPFVREVLIHACMDEDVSVREAALVSLGQVVVAVPREAPYVQEALINACKDVSVRVAALDSLGQVVVAVPGEAPCVINRLFDIVKDEDLCSCGAALKEFSVQQLMDAYWMEQNEGFIPFIVGRLYHTPLIVQNSLNPHQQRLVLYTTARQAVRWDKPREGVQCFVRQIQACSVERTRSDL